MQWLYLPIISNYILIEIFLSVLLWVFGEVNQFFKLHSLQLSYIYCPGGNLLIRLSLLSVL